METFGNVTAVIEWVLFFATAIASCILGWRMRHRIRKVLGIKVKNETELTPLKTWMDVENAEEKNRGGRLG